MNEKLLRELAVKSMVVMLGTAATSYGIGTASVANASFEENVQIDDSRIVSIGDEQNQETEKVYKNLETGVTVNQLAENYLVLEKPEDKSYKITIEDLYMERQLKISVAGLEEKIFSRRNLFANSSESTFAKKVNLVYDYIPESFSYTAVYEVELDTVYGYQLYEDADAFYIELWEPSELYNRILVVDAGHGGNDIGTYSPDMQYYEKDINLNIVKYLSELLEQDDIKVYYTRQTDKKVYLNPRIDLANELKADLMVSVHCNSTDETNSASGCEVLFGTKNQKNLSFTSKDFAEICLQEMTKDGSLRNRGLLNNNDIYIIEKSKVPLALIEVGFMTNKNDLEYLIKEDNQKQMAEHIHQAVLTAFSTLEK